MVDPIPVASCSKAPRGLSVLPRVTCIFTGTSVSPSAWPRQRPTRCAIRAGRNLPDKEFRYLRTVHRCYSPQISPRGAGLATSSCGRPQDRTISSPLWNRRVRRIVSEDSLHRAPPPAAPSREPPSTQREAGEEVSDIGDVGKRWRRRRVFPADCPHPMRCQMAPLSGRAHLARDTAPFSGRSFQHTAEFYNYLGR
jgi:hypothetical protein